MSKLINVSDDIYEQLNKLKDNESFSTTIRKLLLQRSNKEEILKRFGKGEIDEKRMKELKKGWKKWTEKYA